MTVLISRRNLLAAFASTALVGASRADEGGRYGAPTPFSFDTLVETARILSTKPYAPTPIPNPDLVDRIDYTEHMQIRSTAAAVVEPRWSHAVTPFHVGKFFKRPVRLHAVKDGKSREVLSRPGDFDVPDGNPAKAIAGNDVYAGFRVHEGARHDSGDWLAFLGASYFRSSGDSHQYGLSARGIAVDVADPEPPFKEDFPDFTSFWIEEAGPEKIRIYALLDGASITGAFTIEATRAPKVEMDVVCALFPRREIHRLGIAPMSSMYWYGKPIRWDGVDLRLEVHDSDGLAMITGKGEQIWRPLNNPTRVMTSTFRDENPQAFALVQRERKLAAYDDDIHFERRPDLVVEPLGKWGRGSVELVEIPTRREYDDNIVVHWTPEKRAAAGDRLDFAYRLHWCAGYEFPGDAALCTSTRLDLGSTCAANELPSGDLENSRQFVVDFTGGVLAGHDPRQCVPVIELSRGRTWDVGIWPAPDGNPKRFRLWFTVGSSGGEPIEMRIFIKSADGRGLTETWLYQYHPLQAMRKPD
jgi:glucans biosynthesis protein